MNKIHSKEEWIDHVKSFKETKKPVKRYCLENNLKPSSFRHWLNKGKKPDIQTAEKKSFVKLEMKEPQEEKKENTFLLKYNLFVIIVPADFSKSDLSRILDVLEERR